MRTMMIAILLMAELGTTGCAYLTTYNRSIDLNGGSVAMDVKQRIVFSQKRPPDKDEKGTIKADPTVVVCAEPSPDALTVLGVSGSLSLNKGETVANATSSLSESGAFVGLRTQSIQLLRDAMYRLCEGYASGAVTDTDFAAMQRRYQSTMMGLIAIEQLTRPVIAGQALLTSAAASQSGASAGDASVDKAQERLDAAKTAVLTAQTDLDKATARYDKAQASARDLNDKLETQLKKKPEDQDATAIATIKGQIAIASQEVEDSRLALADAKRRHISAEEEVRIASVGLRTAQSRASVSASGGGALGFIAESAAKSAEHLTKGVAGIVVEINRSYTKDACLALLTELVRSPTTLMELGRIDRDRAEAKTEMKTSGAATDVLSRSLSTCERILAAEQARAESAPAPVLK
jgi:hypothetical protein